MVKKRIVEDYMKTIYNLQKQGIVRGAYIARALSVSKPTVSVMLKKLEQEGYLFVRDDYAVILTSKGRNIAMRIIERNNAFYRLLVNLGIDESLAEKDAHSMEHALSQESFDALMKFTKSKFS